MTKLFVLQEDVYYKMGGQTKHGHCIGGDSREYKVWTNMIQRCFNPKDPKWKHYGGRGIRVCDRWQRFENFYADMGPRPEGMSIDRWPDNNGNYEPGNCCWATQSEQMRNKRTKEQIMDAKVVMEPPKKLGRPPSRKALLTLRLEQEVVDHFRAFGPGWLANVNDTLKGVMEEEKKAALVEQVKAAAAAKRRATWAAKRMAKANG